MKFVYQVLAVMAILLLFNSCVKEKESYDGYQATRSMIIGEWNVKKFIYNGKDALDWVYLPDTSTYTCLSGTPILCSRHRRIVSDFRYKFDDTGSLAIMEYLNQYEIDIDSTMANCRCTYYTSTLSSFSIEQPATWVFEKGKPELGVTMTWSFDTTRYSLLELKDKYMRLKYDGVGNKQEIELEKN